MFDLLKNKKKIMVSQFIISCLFVVYSGYVYFKFMSMREMIGEASFFVLFVIVLFYVVIIISAHETKLQQFRYKWLIFINIAIFFVITGFFTNFVNNKYIFVDIDNEIKCTTGIFIFNPLHIYKVDDIFVAEKMYEYDKKVKGKVGDVFYNIQIESIFELSKENTIEIVNSANSNTPYIRDSLIFELLKEGITDKDNLEKAILEKLKNNKDYYPWNISEIELKISTAVDCP